MKFRENNFGKNTGGKGGSFGQDGEEGRAFGDEGEDDGTFVGNSGTVIYQIGLGNVFNTLINILHLVILSTFYNFLYFQYRDENPIIQNISWHL